jgi:ABC-type sugar transport system ATPase subunit
MTMADKIVVLKGGAIEQVGSPMELYRHPATPFVAGFIGSPRMNLYSGEIAERFGCKTYGIRPEHIRLSETDGRWQGKVRHVERLGAEAIIHLDITDMGEMVVRAEGETPFEPGAMVWATPLETAAHRFNS